MSIINQMLKDLEQRTPAELDRSPDAVPVVMQARLEENSTNKLNTLVIPGLLLVIIAMAATWWWSSNTTNSSSVLVAAGASPVNHSNSGSPNNDLPGSVAKDVSTQIVSARGPEVHPAKLESAPQNHKPQMKLQHEPQHEPQHGVADKPVTDNQTTDVQTRKSTAPASPDIVPESTDVVETKPEAESQARHNQPLQNSDELVKTPENSNSETVTALPEPELAINSVELNAPELAKLKYRQATTENNRGETLKARQLWQQVLTLQPGFHQARAELAASLFGAGEIAQALAVLNQGIQLAPQHGHFRLMAARIYYQQQNVDQALVILGNDLRWLVTQPELLEMRASLAQQSGQFQLAKESYQGLLSLTPDHNRWLMGLAISYDQLQQFPRALAVYRQAINHHSRSQGKPLGEASRHYVKQRIAALGG